MIMKFFAKFHGKLELLRKYASSLDTSSRRRNEIHVKYGSKQEVSKMKNAEHEIIRFINIIYNQISQDIEM